jgi:hypothetical protein
MPEVDPTKCGNILSSLLVAYHGLDLISGDEQLHDAVIVKSVALLALAFDIPPTDDDESVDIDDTLARLSFALKQIKELKGAPDVKGHA